MSDTPTVFRLDDPTNRRMPDSGYPPIVNRDGEVAYLCQRDRTVESRARADHRSVGHGDTRNGVERMTMDITTPKCGHHGTPLAKPTVRPVPDRLAHIALACHHCFPELFHDGWASKRIAEHPDIDHENPTVRELAELLHRSESYHMHDNPQDVTCAYCALRATKAMRFVWDQQRAGEYARLLNTRWRAE